MLSFDFFDIIMITQATAKEGGDLVQSVRVRGGLQSMSRAGQVPEFGQNGLCSVQYC